MALNDGIIDYRRPTEVMAVTATQYSNAGSASIDTLNIPHPDYHANLNAWVIINDLVSGGSAMSRNKHKYLLPRVGEDGSLYQKRLQQFVYTPVLADAVRDLVKKLRTGMLNISVDDQTIIEAQKSYDVMDLLGETMRHWVLFGVSWTAIDANERGLPLPRLINPLSVINWSYDNQGLEWVVVKTYETRSKLFARPDVVNVWTITDREKVRRFESVNGGAVSLVSEYPLLNIGVCPFHHYVCKAELWTASQAYLKQLQHLWVENGVTDASTTLYIQRVIKPNHVPDDDLGDSYLNSAQDGGLYSSNAHIIEGDFNFAEASGSSITVNLNLLARIEAQIKAIIAMGGMETQGKVESGESKKYDYADYANTLTEYGHNLTVWYRQLLTQMIVLSGGVANSQLEVTGLDAFELNNIDTMLAQSEKLNKVAANLSETALKHWYTDLSLQLVGSVPAAIKEQIRREVEVKVLSQPNQPIDPVVSPPNTNQ